MTRGPGPAAPSRWIADAAATVGTIVLAATALGVVGIAGYRGLSASPAPAPAVVEGGSWHRVAGGRHVLGPADAPVKVVVFNDFQCPYCASVAPELHRLRERYPREVAVVYRHFPLKMLHPHAMDAAAASECAGEQGRFAGFHDLLFAKQDSIGVKPWRELARGAGVGDLGRFQACLGETAPRQAVNADLTMGRGIGVRGTPAIFVNGIARTGGITLPQLDSLVKVALGAQGTDGR